MFPMLHVKELVGDVCAQANIRADMCPTNDCKKTSNERERRASLTRAGIVSFFSSSPRLITYFPIKTPVIYELLGKILSSPGITWRDQKLPR